MAAWSERNQRNRLQKDTCHETGYRHHRRFQRLWRADRPRARRRRPHRLRQRCARPPAATRSQVAEVARYAARYTASICARVELDVASDRIRGCRHCEDHRRQRASRRGDPQCRPHGVRSGGSVHAGAVRATLRRQRAYRPSASTGRRCRSCASRAGACVVWVSSSSARRRHAALSVALFRGEGGDGFARGVYTPANWRAGASRPRSSCRARSPAAPTTSRIPARRRQGARRGV